MWCVGSRTKTHVCERENCPRYFVGGGERERAGCVQDVAQFRVGDGRWRLKLVGQLSSGRNLDKEFA